MVTVLPPPASPPMFGSGKQNLSLDDLKDKFWAVVTRELESNSADLAPSCEQLLRNIVSRGATVFLSAPPAKQNLDKALWNLGNFMGKMIEIAKAQQKMAASAGGSQAVVILDEAVLSATINRAKSEGWTFWPFSVLW